MTALLPQPGQPLTVAIRDHFDIIEARMQVRALARTVGLDLFDQARISLATSTMAIILGLERTEGGLITMERLDEKGRAGVQVVCTKGDAALHGLASGVLDDAKRMVDDLMVEALPSRGIKVTMIKWTGGTSRRQARYTPEGEGL